MTLGKRTKTVMRRTVLLIAALLVPFLLGVMLARVTESVQHWLYPREYNTAVQYWAEEYQIDPLLLDAFICTESGFDPQAQSNAGARGLLQITEETFLWIKSKIAPDEPLTFDDLYNPDVNIRFGAYYISACLKRYDQDISTAAAAYHSGWGTVDRLLANSDYSSNGKILNEFPYARMQNYVVKINRHYQKYLALYWE